MNRHFEDTRYYLRRAVETAKKGITEELEPIRGRVHELVGDDEEPEPGRIEAIRDELGIVQERAEGEAREAIEEAREKFGAYREKPAR